ncbi:hypothetical protein R84981_001830 [Carnimonas sp. R-84981]|uniref:IMPACT family protein n=1 Tax=Carnimonas bestiolae TaxID=3402172 RepID=UPI003EDBAD1D
MATTHRYQVPAVALTAPHSAEFEVSKSRFITWIARCESIADAQQLEQLARATYADARHHCSAFIAGAPGEQVAIGFSDDGEPGGTAGRPIYQVLEGSGLGQLGCVVIRYFGGIKLGTGGLVRAYTKAALLALEHLPTQAYVSTEPVKLQVGFSDEHPARHWCETAGARITQVDYSANGPVLTLEWPCDQPLQLDQLALSLTTPPQLVDTVPQ